MILNSSFWKIILFTVHDYGRMIYFVESTSWFKKKKHYYLSLTQIYLKNITEKYKWKHLWYKSRNIINIQLKLISYKIRAWICMFIIWIEYFSHLNWSKLNCIIKLSNNFIGDNWSKYSFATTFQRKFSFKIIVAF